MASLQKRPSGRYRIIFCYGGKRFFASLKTKHLGEAQASLARLEENLRDLERGRLQLPPGADPVTFLLSDGKLNHKPTIAKPMILKEVFDHYQQKHPAAAKEENTGYTEGIHINHLIRIIGAETAIRAMTTETVQAYIDQRSQEIGRRGNTVSNVTIKREVGTLAAIWNKWALPQGFVIVPSPTRGLVYPKSRAKPPFQTWEQIERRVARGGLTPEQEDELWDALFLTLPEIDELLKFVQQNARHELVYVMFCFAAHTGARRSEMLRSRVDDFDFDTDTVTIREKKRDRSKELTFRTVPLSPFLKQAMQDWFAVHPGGQLTICQEANKPLTVQLAAHHFRWVLDETDWEKLKGWHVLRHSFASNCAAKGVDQRIIDEWMGHQTEEMRRRYRHLIPSTQRDAIMHVFGNGNTPKPHHEGNGPLRYPRAQ
jgi:integrase